MSEASRSPGPESASEARASEAAAIRRRWITLGEVLAVMAVLISALTLYLNWSDRKAERADKMAESRKASAGATSLVLDARTDGDDRLLLTAGRPDQIVQSQTILFPGALGLPPVDTTGAPRIEARWFAGALKKARSAANLPDDSVGDERLPVAITTRFLIGGEARETVALYDIGYGIAGRWITGHSLSLRGLSRVGTLKPGDAQARVDDRWKQSTGTRP